AVVVDDHEIAVAAHRQLLPFRDLVGIASRSGVGCLGPVATTLGLCAELVGDDDTAIGHYEAAMEVSGRLGAPVCLADAQWALARVLDRCADEAARNLAGHHRDAARRTAAEYEVDLPLNGIAPKPTGPMPASSTAPPGATPSSSTPPRVSTPPTPADPRPTMTSDDDLWTITFGGRTVRVRHSVGLDHLAALLSAPRHERHVLELSGGQAAGDRTVAGTEVLDDDAKRAYRSRIAQLQDVLDDFDARGDVERSERAQVELERVVNELRRAMGLGGRDRSLGDVTERARAAVTKALRTAIRRVGERQPIIGEHLSTHVRTGIFCSYQGPDDWLVVRTVVPADGDETRGRGGVTAGAGVE
ncbi:MAG: hypothetical protein ABIR68_03690, partial [Ilumatobacteraceae bacterium]